MTSTERAVLDTLRAHLYDTRNRGSKPADLGWHVCSCGWEGYWSDWQPHVAELVAGASGHEPTLARRSDGKWGVFCTGCSSRVGDYIYPCKAFPNNPGWPPAVLMEVSDGT